MKKIEQALSKLIYVVDIDDVIDVLEGLGKLTFVDEKIDDGIDDGDDNYLMMRAFDLKIDDNIYYVRLYYGDNTRLFTYYNFTKLA